MILIAILCVFVVGTQPVSAGIHQSNIYAHYGFNNNKLQTLKNDLTIKKSNKVIIEAYLLSNGGARDHCLLHFYVKDHKGKVLINQEGYTHYSSSYLLYLAITFYIEPNQLPKGNYKISMVYDGGEWPKAVKNVKLHVH